ncbi:MAG: EamA family transporter [Bacteroidales bacterium]|nr:EamA family transporter [Bacteroidales bacterium]
MTELQRKAVITGSLAIGFSAVLWGFDGAVLTPRLYNLDVMYVVFILHLLPFLVMNIFMFREYRKIHLMPRKDIIIFLLISLFGGAIGTLAIVKALFLMDFNHLSVVILLQKLQPVFAIMLATTFLHERLRKNFFYWAGLAVIGGYFLTFGFALPNLQTDEKTIYASLLAMLATLSFSSSTVLSKKILGTYAFTTSTFYRYGFTSFIMLIFMSIAGDFSQFINTTAENWIFIVIIGATTGSGAIMLYYYGLRKVKASLATISELMYPVSAVIFDYFVNGSLLSPVQWFAAAIMIFAILKLTSNDNKS